MMMIDIEKLLKANKEDLDQLVIPQELEIKLRTALDKIPDKNKKIRKSKSIKIAAIVTILILFAGYHLDTLAYYGKQILGYDQVMNGTLKELNNLGKGQKINQTYTFKNGVQVTLDGIMLDDNNMILFFTIQDPKGDAGNIPLYFRMADLWSVFGKEYRQSGEGMLSEDGKELKWIITLNAPRFFQKKMELELGYYGDDGVIENGSIPFKIDRNKAMGSNLKIWINKKILLDQRKIKIESLLASPTATMIKGEIQNIVQLGLDQMKGERFRPENIEILLLGDGKEIQQKTSGLRTDIKGSRFHISYDALPPETTEIEVRLVSFGGDHDTKTKVKLNKGEINQNIKLFDQDIIIDQVYQSDGNTYITITTEDNLALSRVFLNIDGEPIPLQETISRDNEKIAEGDDVVIKYTRTLVFPEIGEELELDIQRIRYKKVYDKIIYKDEIKS